VHICPLPLLYVRVYVCACVCMCALLCVCVHYCILGDNGVGFPYHGDEGPLLPFYKELQAVASSAPGKVRVLIYSGDTDPCINTFWSQNWTSHVGFEETAAWRPWTLDGKQRMGGYVTRCELFKGCCPCPYRILLSSTIISTTFCPRFSSS
jgi:hypothetical protein